MNCNVTFLGAITLLLALAIGNFGYELAKTTPDYMNAVEHTYFQAWALFLAWSVWRKGGIGQ